MTMITKQIRLKNGFRYIQRCFDCPCVEKTILGSDPWFRCGLGTSLPERVSLINIMPPVDCLLEDYDA